MWIGKSTLSLSYFLNKITMISPVLWVWAYLTVTAAKLSWVMSSLSRKYFQQLLSPDFGWDYEHVLALTGVDQLFIFIEHKLINRVLNGKWHFKDFYKRLWLSGYITLYKRKPQNRFVSWRRMCWLGWRKIFPSSQQARKHILLHV